MLVKYADILTTFRDGGKETKAVLVIVSGSRSLDMLDGETVRYAALDDSLADLNSDVPASLVPWVSGQWNRTFNQTGQTSLSSLHSSCRIPI